MTVLNLDISVGTLKFEPYRGLVTFYLVLTIFNRSVWLQRWDTPRIGHLHPILWHGRKMSWNCGYRRGTV